jgi:hypothetical protein
MGLNSAAPVGLNLQVARNVDVLPHQGIGR